MSVVEKGFPKYTMLFFIINININLDDSVLDVFEITDVIIVLCRDSLQHLFICLFF